MSEVRDNEKLNRYELTVDGKTAFSEYRLSPGTITFMHTEVPNEFRGKGIGSKLARGVLEAARARGLKVVARCPFIAAYIREHAEFQDLLSKP
jgi:predicted GNAT family acetyltransferase